MRCTGFSRKLCKGSECCSWAWRSCSHRAAAGDSESSRSRARELQTQHRSGVVVDPERPRAAVREVSKYHSRAWSGASTLTSGSSCSTTCRCQTLHSAKKTGVRGQCAWSLPCRAPPIPPGELPPPPGRLTHPLHEAFSNAPCTATALQVLQQLAVGESGR